MAWVYLLLAGLLEIVMAYGIKQIDGFNRLWPILLTVAAATPSMLLLNMATKTIPLGTAYAVWTGIGAVGTVILGIVVFDEPFEAVRLVWISLIVAGILGLNLTSH